jgi:hypothetical protein
MATVAATTPKVNRVYYAILDDVNGVLMKVNGALFFLADSGDITEVEVQHLPFLTPLGELGIADAQQAMDRLHGGYAKIACARAN